ncbi:MAG: SURF1 family protein [Pseudomonadota bacterium]
MPITFRFRWIPFIATLVVVAIGVSLGQWQTRRAAEKQAIETRLIARENAAPIRLAGASATVEELEFRRIIVRGEFVRDWPVYLDNRPYKGLAGFYLLMPLKIAGTGTHVLVNRGWLPRDPLDRAKLPSIATPAGMVDIEGIVRRNSGNVLQLGKAESLRPGAIVQNADLAGFAQASSLALQPFIIEQLGNTQDGLVRDWPRPSTGIDKHLGYAFQWYALAAMAFIFFVVTGFRRGTK